MTALVVAGLLGIVLGGVLSALPGPARRRALAPGRGSARARAGGSLGALRRRRLGRPVHERADSAGRHRRDDAASSSPCWPSLRALRSCSRRRYLPSTRAGRITGALGAAFLLALIGVLCARDALSFLFFWELMTLVPAAIILTGTSTEAARHTVFTYVAITHLGGAGTWIALLLLAHEGAIGDATALSEGSGVQAVIAVAAIIGFGTKAGLMPMHVWLPRAHPIAPASISALMSGVMVAVAAYGLIRVLVDWLGPPPAWVGATMLVLGGLSALGGITYALFQRDLKRLLAYSTVEHLGIVALGARRLPAAPPPRRRPVGRVRARGGAPAHAQPRNLQGAPLPRRRRVRARDGGARARPPRRPPATDALERRRLPRRRARDRRDAAAQRLRLGVADAAGAPPRAGVRRCLGRDARGARSGGARGTMALAVLCFVKVIGLVLLGPPRAVGVRRGGRAARPDAVGARRARRRLRRPRGRAGPAPPSPRRPRTWADPGDVPVRPGLDLPGTGNLPTLGFLVVVCRPDGAPLARPRQPPRRAPAPRWASGQPVEPQLLWTSAGFSKPLRLVLEAVLRPAT